MSRRFLCFLSISFVFYTSLTAQINLNLKVLSVDTNLPIAFSSVKLIGMEREENEYVQQGITDVDGNICLNDLQIGGYRLGIYSMGYEHVDTIINIRYPSSGDINMYRTVFLHTDKHIINEIVVNGRSTTQSIDKKTVMITPNDLRNSVTGIDLLYKMEGLYFDESDQKIKTGKNDNIKLLINGVSASESEILLLEAKDVKKIEHYDFPPAKYAGYSKVLNYITKRKSDGFTFGTNLQHAFTTIFGNDNITSKYNWGNNQISIDASTQYRSYKKVEGSECYKYKLFEEIARVESYNRKFGYDDNRISISFCRNVDSLYLIDIKFSPNFQHRYSRMNSNILHNTSSKNQERFGYAENKNYQFTPSVDAFANIYLPHKQELTINIVGSYFDASADHLKYDILTNGDTTFSDNGVQKNKKKSLIGELVYTKSHQLMQLTIGNNTNVGYLNSYINNSFDNSNFRTKTFSNYSYCSIQNVHKNLMYRFTLGLQYYKNSNNQNTFSSCSFLPLSLVGWNYCKKASIRTVFSIQKETPTLSQLSNNRIVLFEDFVTTGNPYLKNSSISLFGLIHDCNTKWLSSNINILYVNQSRPINTYFSQKNGIMSLQHENAKKSTSFIINGTFLISPFPIKKYVNLKFDLLYSDVKLYSDIVGGCHKKTFSSTYEIVINLKKIKLSYLGNIRGWDLDGTYIKLGENISNFTVGYNHNKNLSCRLSVLWLGCTANYKTASVSPSIVNYSFEQSINDNKNMITIGASYRFHIGKKYSTKEKTIYNYDNDTGIF